MHVNLPQVLSCAIFLRLVEPPDPGILANRFHLHLLLLGCLQHMVERETVCRVLSQPHGEHKYFVRRGVMEQRQKTLAYSELMSVARGSRLIVTHDTMVEGTTLSRLVVMLMHFTQTAPNKHAHQDCIKEALGPHVADLARSLHPIVNS